ncbi:diguanylate cyclase domain-containing protein [Pistricoccus aurantiacus]|uniref:sensor domain-containing diguanylate cyclase n=1 Tax=Pistricoccus aurantiacus TaxID=1883414 RepID=UPI0036259E1E
MRSLQGRLLLSLGAGWLMLIAVLLVFAYQVDSRLIQQVNEAHLEYEAELISQQVENAIQLRIDSLVHLAEKLENARREAAALLRENDAALTLFDRLIAVSASGEIQAGWPDLEGLKTLDLSQREYFTFLRATGRSYISRPLVGAVTGTPLVLIGVPLKTAEGGFDGALLGAVQVETSSVFDKLRSVRIGEGGFASLMTAEGRILAHPDAGRIMQRVPMHRPNLELALDGWEGVSEGRLADGRAAMQAYRQVWNASWIVAVQIPLSQLQAPINRLVKMLWWGGIVAALLMLPLLWWLLSLVLKPLHQFERQIAEIKIGKIRRIDSDTRMRELVRLTNTFNELEAQRAAASDRLQERQAFLDAVLNSSPTGVFVVDGTDKVEYVNPALTAITGYALAHYRDAGWSHHIHPHDRRDAVDMWHLTRETLDDHLRQYRYYRADGELLWLEVHSSLVIDGGQVLGYVGIVKDITERREREVIQRWEAEHDPLTHLLNRRGLERRLEEALLEWRMRGESAVLMLFDLDHFKPINDEGGHALGDEMLRKIAETITPVVRKSDYIARHGGDEFAILMPSCSLAQGEVVANKLLKAVRDIRLTHRGKEYGVTMSLGVTSFQPEDRNIETIMRRADQAAYRAKAKGRDRLIMA